MTAPATGTLGYGCNVGYGTVQGTYTNPAQVYDITPPNLDADDVDITNVNSANSFKEFMAGLADAGEVNFKVIYDKADLAALYAQFRVKQWWTVTYSDKIATASKWECQGYLKGIEGEMPLGEKVICSFKVKLSGAPTFTAGT